MHPSSKKFWWWLVLMVFTGSVAFAQPHFPPPDFESGYQLPITTTPAARAVWMQYLDVGVLAVCLGIASVLIHKHRSRHGLFWLSLFSLAYFGFYRKGCICPIGSPQNIALGLFNPGYAVPITVIAFFTLPIVFTLFGGRSFCAGVCPQGAIQDFFLIKPITVPNWLEQGLGIIPFLFLGAGIAYAATGTGFVICRYDPFVPLFRLSGNFFILAAGISFLVLGMFIGRPYCRFLCPYGALLKLASGVSKWRVRVTPDVCTQCRLCENSCPFGAMREPSEKILPSSIGAERKRLGLLLLLLPMLIAIGTLAGLGLAPVAARLHPTVAMAELYLRQQQSPMNYGAMTPEALALARVEKQPEVILAAAADLQRRFRLATALFGAWFGLVVSVKLIALSIRQKRADSEPDRGACFACARCFADCPSERVRLGVAPAESIPAVTTLPILAKGK